MKKFVAALISLVIMSAFAGLAWWLYRNFHTTPMLIANLLIILTGVLISYTVFHKLSEDLSNAIIVKESEYPEIEHGLIYAEVNDFCNKYEKHKGELFIAGIDLPQKEFDLINVNYKKLIDEITFKFSPSLTIKLNGVATIAVGDNQFLIFGFESGQIRSNKIYELDWKRNKLIVNQKDTEQKSIKTPSQSPTIIFSWT